MHRHREASTGTGLLMQREEDWEEYGDGDDCNTAVYLTQEDAAHLAQIWGDSGAEKAENFLVLRCNWHKDRPHITHVASTLAETGRERETEVVLITWQDDSPYMIGKIPPCPKAYDFGDGDKFRCGLTDKHPLPHRF